MRGDMSDDAVVALSHPGGEGIRADQDFRQVARQVSRVAVQRVNVETDPLTLKKVGLGPASDEHLLFPDRPT
jgi:hypothetical protein